MLLEGKDELKGTESGSEEEEEGTTSEEEGEGTTSEEEGEEFEKLYRPPRGKEKTGETKDDLTDVHVTPSDHVIVHRPTSEEGPQACCQGGEERE